MADARKLPPPIDPKTEPITVAVLTGKLEGLFGNVKELVESTARRTENALRKEMREIEKRLDSKIDGVEKRLDTMSLQGSSLYSLLSSLYFRTGVKSLLFTFVSLLSYRGQVFTLYFRLFTFVTEPTYSTASKSKVKSKDLTP